MFINKYQNIWGPTDFWVWMILPVGAVPCTVRYLAASLASALEMQFDVFQSLSCVWFSAIPWMAARQASLAFTVSQSLLKLMSIELVMPSNHLTLCHPLLLLLSIFPSIRVFSNESALCIMWPKYWTLSISINPSNKYSGLISFRIDWFDLAVHGTVKSLL